MSDELREMMPKDERYCHHCDGWHRGEHVSLGVHTEVRDAGQSAGPDDPAVDPFYVLDFCEAAIKDAVLLEDGLDASTADAVLSMIVRARALRVSGQTAGAPSRDVLDAARKMTLEHDADVAYYEAEVKVTRQQALNANEWPVLEAEIARLGEVRTLIQAAARLSGGSET